MFLEDLLKTLAPRMLNMALLSTGLIDMSMAVLSRKWGTFLFVLVLLKKTRRSVNGE